MLVTVQRDTRQVIKIKKEEEDYLNFPSQNLLPLAFDRAGGFEQVKHLE
jgi:hypothetical protein